MTQITELLEAIGAFAWPAIVVFVILRFASAVRPIIESAKWRKFTIKVGSQELTMEELTQQQAAILDDLQFRVAQTTDHGLTKQSIDVQLGRTKKKETINSIRRSVLWVDDNPRNNGYFIQMLHNKGIEVTTVLSTDQGMRHYIPNRYGMIISDMGRKEDGTYQADAGISLLKKIRERDKAIPFIIYCTEKKVAEYSDLATTNGVTKITSSYNDLYSSLIKLFNLTDA